MELAEVLGANDLKPEIVAVAILSVPDLGLREQLTKSIPRASANNILLELKDRGEPKPAEVGGARLQLIKKARELEKAGKLASVQMPRFRSGHFAA